jgi:hypothetical protein
MDLADDIAETVLNAGSLGPNGRQVYGYHVGKIYEFQPDNTGGYHGYPIPGIQTPPAYLRALRDAGIISGAEYNQLRRQSSQP